MILIVQKINFTTFLIKSHLFFPLDIRHVSLSPGEPLCASSSSLFFFFQTKLLPKTVGSKEEYLIINTVIYLFIFNWEKHSACFLAAVF